MGFNTEVPMGNRFQVNFTFYSSNKWVLVFSMWVERYDNCETSKQVALVKGPMYGN